MQIPHDIQTQINEWFKIQLHEHPKCPTFDYKQKESQ